MRGENLTARILAIDPCSKGFGFAVLEAPARLIDWGVARVWSANDDAFLARLDALIGRYRPSCAVIEVVTAVARRPRTVRRLRLAEALLMSRGVTIHRIERTQVAAAFTLGRPTKYAIATEIARAFPDVAPWLPRRRMPWMSEDDRMHLFDAVALAVGLLHAIGSPSPSLRLQIFSGRR